MAETQYTHWNCSGCPAHAAIEWFGDTEKDPIPVPDGWRHFVGKTESGRLERVALCNRCLKDESGCSSYLTRTRYVEVMEAGPCLVDTELEAIQPKEKSGKVVPRHRNPFITKNRRMKINLDTSMWE